MNVEFMIRMSEQLISYHLACFVQRQREKKNIRKIHEM